MMTKGIQSSSLYPLANWLAFQENKDNVISKAKYHLAGRALLLVNFLAGLAIKVVNIFVINMALLASTLSLISPERVKEFVSRREQQRDLAGFISSSCFYSLASPKNLMNFLQPQNQRPSITAQDEQEPLLGSTVQSQAMPQELKLGKAFSTQKLEKHLNRAIEQSKQEEDKAFTYINLVKERQDFCDFATQKIVGKKYLVGTAHLQGRRSTMEDEDLAVSFTLNVNGKDYPVALFGIFDGHAGDQASTFVKNNLQKTLQENLNKECSEEITDAKIWNALKKTFEDLHKAFKEQVFDKLSELVLQRIGSPGTTATVAMILNEHIWVANVGDSRTILDNGIQLSEDAKPDTEYYKKWIENHGGEVFDGRIQNEYRNLAVAKAIGDCDFDGINPRPKITQYPLNNLPKKTHLILTCDGIYEVASTRQIAKAVTANNTQSPRQLAANIVHSAFEAKSGDNLSAIVVKLS